MVLQNELLNTFQSLDTVPLEISVRFRQRISEGNFSRDENVASHFCTMVAPFDPDTQKIFIAHHKKSGLWLFPGGHLDLGEKPLTCLDREGEEELGLSKGRLLKSKLFWCSIVEIENPVKQKCRTHFDYFFVENLRQDEIKVNLEEFHEVGWFTFSQARQQITSNYYLETLNQLEKYLETK